MASAHDPLHDALRREAKAIGPRFSHTLHQRTMESIRQLQPVANPRPNWVTPVLAIAASVALCATAWFVLEYQQGGVTMVVDADLPRISISAPAPTRFVSSSDPFWRGDW